MRQLFLLSILILPGCIVAALGVGAAAGILVHEAYVADDSFEAVYRSKIDVAYDAALSVMEDLASETTYSRKDRTIRGEVQGADVKVLVKPREGSSDEVVVLITARKNYLADRDTAQYVFRQLNRKITRS